MADADQIANDLAALTDELARIGLDDTAQGGAADAFRQRASQNGQRLTELTDAARAVAAAVEQHKTLLADRDATTPTESELTAAKEAVTAASRDLASGTGTQDDFRRATEHLAQLLARKKAAQERFTRGEQNTAETLSGATQELPEPDAAGLGNGPSPLASLLSTLGQLAPAAMSGAPSGAPPASGENPAGQPGFDPQTAALLDSLLPGNDGESSDFVDPSDIDESGFVKGAGQTHVSADIPQPATLAGVQTLADVSGRPANPFTASGVAPGGVATTTPTAGGAGMPMAPMAPPPGSAGSTGATSGKTSNAASIINTDPDFTGADLEQQVATSGIIGRGEKPHTGGK